MKGPKTARGKRTITIDDDLIALLMAERERYLRIMAGVPDGAPVDLSLVKLPADALMFPRPPSLGESFCFIEMREPRTTTKQFVRIATALGFPGLRFHDLRGTHATLLLNAGVPAHVVAERCGHDTAVLWSNYGKPWALVPSTARSIRSVFAATSRSLQRRANISLRLAPVNAATATIENNAEPRKP